MAGQRHFTTRDGTVIETGGVVGRHGTFIVSTVSIHQLHTLYRIRGLVQLAKYLQQIPGYGTMTHHLPHPNMTVTVVVQHAQITQLTAGDRGAMTIRGLCHGAEKCIGQRIGGEVRFYFLAGTECDGLRTQRYPQTTYKQQKSSYHVAKVHNIYQETVFPLRKNSPFRVFCLILPRI
jgi:hypothetical protein